MSQLRISILNYYQRRKMLKNN